MHLGCRMSGKQQLPIQYLVHFCTQRIGQIGTDKVIRITACAAGFQQIKLGGKFPVDELATTAQ